MSKRTKFDSVTFCVTSRIWRRMHGFTQAEVAGVCHISTGKMSLIEAGEVAPTIAELSRICEFMDVDVSDFFVSADKVKNGY